MDWYNLDPHGHGTWHLIIDLWWVVAFAATSPLYWFRAKVKSIFKGKTHE